VTPDCPELTRLGQVPAPPPAVLQAARETLWAAVADEMLAPEQPAPPEQAAPPHQAAPSHQAAPHQAAPHRPERRRPADPSQ
jgi:hypothetical protein